MIKVTFFFEHGPYGWAESHYLVASGASVADAVNQAPALAAARGAILGAGFLYNTTPQEELPQPYLHYIRCSDTTKKRQVQFVSMPGRSLGEVYYAGNYPEDVYGAADFQNNSLRVSAFGTNGVQSICYLGGIPRGINPSGRTVDVSFVPGLTKAWNAWVKQITNGTWGFLYKDKSVKPVPIQSVSVSQAAPALLVISAPLVGPVDATMKVQISGADMMSPNYKPLNGVYKIYYVSQTTPLQGLFNLTLAGTLNRDPTQIEHMGFAQIVNPQVVPYSATQYLPIGLSSRKRGEPFRGPHGRKKPAKVYVG